MKNRVKKVLMLTGILCIMGITLCACQGTKEVSDENQNQEEIGRTDSKVKDILNEDQEQEDPSETNSEDDAADDTLNQESNTENTDKTNGSQSEAKGGEINTAAPNLEGTIKEIQEKQLTVVESIIEESENGGDIMVGPGSGDDSEFSKVTVTYDDNTVFVIKNIYDGGARSETENGTSSDLTTGQMVEIWGTSAADGLQATQICIVKVVSD
ncbi:hypothetical protein E5329_20250 [Petralouisia muris]|uniref:Uncharacterized protein n=1 Tax=Petralouisia muris TaxID=3032872 RepID=A0AC61RRY9_9FIRM|nr:DUF5666 domain-containing protein [Petralouisia muris]TGY91633.1 hypothetical protein E5329_20250 [Petralouisia muris]